MLNALLLASLALVPPGPSDPSNATSPPPAVAADAPRASHDSVEGEYLEVRTCDVWTGPCYANAEVNETGKEAALAWKVTRGVVSGADLAGLKVAAVVRSNDTLGDPYAGSPHGRAVLFVDAAATAPQRAALEQFARAQLGGLAGRVDAVRAVPIDLVTGACAKLGCARLQAGDQVRVETRCVCAADKHCGNESVYYPPLTDVVASTPAVARSFTVDVPELDASFTELDRRGAFTGTFAFAAPLGLAALLVAAPALDGETHYALKPFDVAAGDDARPHPEGSEALPKEIPEAFRSVLDTRGLRLSSGAAEAMKPFYDFYFVKELPLGPAKDGGLSIQFPRLVPGTFVGVLHARQAGRDYRDNPIKAGFYALRYGLQPADGNHLGTADTRDFLCLTGFQDDKDPAPVKDMDALQDLSLLASASDHPTVLYLVRPDLEPADEPRFYQRPDKDEWIADFTLPARGEGDEQPGRVRFGLVLVGHSEHP